MIVFEQQEKNILDLIGIPLEVGRLKNIELEDIDKDNIHYVHFKIVITKIDIEVTVSFKKEKWLEMSGIGNAIITNTDQNLRKEHYNHRTTEPIAQVVWQLESSLRAHTRLKPKLRKFRYKLSSFA
jgi:hypothetical protein